MQYIMKGTDEYIFTEIIQYINENYTNFEEIDGFMKSNMALVVSKEISSAHVKKDNSSVHGYYVNLWLFLDLKHHNRENK